MIKIFDENEARDIKKNQAPNYEAEEMAKYINWENPTENIKNVVNSTSALKESTFKGFGTVLTCLIVLACVIIAGIYAFANKISFEPFVASGSPLSMFLNKPLKVIVVFYFLSFALLITILEYRKNSVKKALDSGNYQVTTDISPIGIIANVRYPQAVYKYDKCQKYIMVNFSGNALEENIKSIILLKINLENSSFVEFVAIPYKENSCQ